MEIKPRCPIRRVFYDESGGRSAGSSATRMAAACLSLTRASRPGLPDALCALDSRSGTRLDLAGVEPGEAWLRVDQAQNTIENAWIKLAIAADGSLTVIDKVNQASYPDLAIFEDGGDAGDTYNYFVSHA